MPPRIEIEKERIADFCRKWKIRELSFFGSVLRDDFGPESDVDVLASYMEEAQWSLLDHYYMQEELAEIFGRKVDLLTRRAVEQSRNWIRRKAILEGAETVYVQG